MKRILLGAAALGVAFGVAGAAHAVPLSGTFHVTVYQGVGNGDINNPIEQANKANPLLATAPVGTFTYTGALDFASPPGANTVAGFIATGGGSTVGTVPNTILSNGGFSATSLFVITGTTAQSIAGTVSHDDGASLYRGGTTIFDSSAPTVEIPTAYTLPAGAFQLYYVEANGLPADLVFDVSRTVPEPATLAVLGSSLFGLGLVRRRRRQG